MEGRPVPKGRAALLRRLMENREKEKTVGQAEPQEPPKPKGRAAMLLKLQQNRAQTVGSTSSQVRVSTSLQSTSGLTQDRIEDLTTHVSQLNFEEKDVVRYKGNRIFRDC